MSFIRVFVTDVDGTLDYRCSGIGERVKKSAVDYVESGGMLALATGRAVISIEKIVKDLNINTPCILFGGSMIYDFEKKEPLWKCTVSNDLLFAAEEIADRHKDVATLVYTDTGIYILNGNDMLWQKGIPEECDKRFLSKEADGNILKINFCGEHETIANIKTNYFSGPEYSFTFSSYHFAEVVSVRAGKGEALKELSRILDVPLNQFIAMGDAQNDLEMLRLAGVSYTLENAPDYMKQAADKVLPHCKEQGAAEGFILAKEILLADIKNESKRAGQG